MKKNTLIACAAAAFLACGAANTYATEAEPGPNEGTLTVTGSIESSISLIIEMAGGIVQDTRTAAVTSDLGSVARYGVNAPTGFQLHEAIDETEWKLSSEIEIRVVQSNSDSSDYTLKAELADALPTGVVWKLDDEALSDSIEITLTTDGQYGAAKSYDWDIVILDSADAGSGVLNNTIHFTATAN